MKDHKSTSSPDDEASSLPTLVALAAASVLSLAAGWWLRGRSGASQSLQESLPEPRRVLAEAPASPRQAPAPQPAIQPAAAQPPATRPANDDQATAKSAGPQTSATPKTPAKPAVAAPKAAAPKAAAPKAATPKAAAPKAATPKAAAPAKSLAKAPKAASPKTTGPKTAASAKSLAKPPVTKPDSKDAKKTFKKAAAHPDDLTNIEGIGPKIQKVLAAAGIDTWSRLAASKPENLRTILRAANPRYRMFDPETWPDQAALAAEGKWEELAKLQEELERGRRA